ncbi:MAG: hypothetical protein DWQ06_12880 [Calditrichaeota bacterium]|nr:MAG: hypothetical protein DWQ06_12880 [Calditrichota bacterium]
MLKFTILILILGLFATMISAQENESPKSPCDFTEAKQFDFWVGEWNLTWADSGKGFNKVEKILGSCVIQENFDGLESTPLKGISVSTYNKNLKKWQQTWVDNSGAYLDFVGEFADGKMILAREFTGKEGKKIMQRMVWFNITKNTLNWNWERSLDEGKTWKPLWQIHYTRK